MMTEKAFDREYANKIKAHTKALHGKDSDVRETPQDFFDKLNEEFHFSLDVCASNENAKCSMYFTPEMDGLKQTWSGNVWCNPPYSNIRPWIAKAERSVNRGDCDLVVMLVPSRTGTDWWHDYAQHHTIRWIRGRLKFGNSKTSAPFDCCLVIIRRPLRCSTPTPMPAWLEKQFDREASEFLDMHRR